MTSQMTIGKKLLLGFGAALTLTLMVSGGAYWSLTSLDNIVDRLVTVHAKNQFTAGRIAMFLSDLIGAERGLIVGAYAKDRAAMEQCNRDFGEALTAWKKATVELRNLTEAADARRILDDMQMTAESLGRLHDDLYRQVRDDKTEAAIDTLKGRVMPSWNQMNEAADRLVEQQSGLMASAQQSADKQVAHDRWVTLAMIALSIVVGSVIVLMVRRINASLRQTAIELAEGAGQVASAASQVSSSSQSLAQGSSEQAALLEETSASSEEINSMARKNSENSRVAADLMTHSLLRFVQANEALEQSVLAISEITSQSDKIGKIIKVIDEIAFQTNILALNAAVEAARAGEAGMGFSVVADEVRSLAQRCAHAAKDTAVLIEGSISKSNDGKVKVDRVALAIRTITEEAARVKALVDEVNMGSHEQVRGVEQIGKSIVQIDQVTQQTAANAEEGASAAEELNAQSATLRDIVERLTAMVGGQGQHQEQTVL